MDKAHDAPGFLVVTDINFLVQLIQFVFSAPYLRVFELNKSILWHELPSPQIAPNDTLDRILADAVIRESKNLH